MREPERIPRIIIKLGRLWQRFPDCRFGEFCAIVNEQMVARGLPVQVVTDAQRQAFDPSYLEDNLFESVLGQLPCPKEQGLPRGLLHHRMAI